jgi:hypothetical protein
MKPTMEVMMVNMVVLVADFLDLVGGMVVMVAGFLDSVGGFGSYDGGYPGFGSGYGDIKKDTNVGAGAGSGNELEGKTGSSGEGAKKGPNSAAEDLGFGAKDHEKKGGFGSYHEDGERRFW